MAIRALLLDKDGPIIPLEPTWSRWAAHVAAALRDVLLESVCCSVLQVDPLTGRVDPDGILATGTMAQIDKALVDAISWRKEQPQEIIQVHVAAAIRAADKAMAAEPMLATDGITATVTAAKAAGIRIAVVTNDHRRSAVPQLQKLGLLRAVDMVVCGDDGHQPKPAAAMLVHALDAFAVAATDALMVGDTAVDHLAAQAAGTGFVLLRRVRPRWLPAQIKHVTHAHALIHVIR